MRTCNLKHVHHLGQTCNIRKTPRAAYKLGLGATKEPKSNNSFINKSKLFY